MNYALMSRRQDLCTYPMLETVSSAGEIAARREACFMKAQMARTCAKTIDLRDEDDGTRNKSMEKD